MFHWVLKTPPIVDYDSKTISVTLKRTRRTSMPLETIENVGEVKAYPPQILPKHASLLPHQKSASLVLALVSIIC